jgi:hygromycin-B 4-O-kinase
MYLTAQQIKAFLGTQYKQEIDGVCRIGGGEWSQAFAFQCGGAEYVVRFGAHKEDFEKDHRVARFASPDLPVPKVTAIGEAFSGYFAISERVYGEMLDALDVEKMHRIVPAVFQTLDAMRTIDLSSTEGYGPWNASGNAPFHSWAEYLLSVETDDPSRRTHGWRDLLARSPVGDGAFQQAFARLKQLANRYAVERHMIHSDLLNSNVFIAQDRISAVIDWGNAMYGDFLYDLAWFSFWAPWYPAMHGIDWEAQARQHFAFLDFTVAHMEERLLCCKIHIGLDAQAYNAFRQRWDELGMNAKRTLVLAGG